MDDRGALFSVDRKYRYGLWRRWGLTAVPYVLFIGLNPSTADENEDDPTIRRCKRFAKDWGCGAVFMSNLFGLRATNPKDLFSHSDPIGAAENDATLKFWALEAKIIVCAWGVNGTHLGRDIQVMRLLSDYKLECLGTTKAGQPRHPLYLRADTPLETFKITAGK